MPSFEKFSDFHQYGQWNHNLVRDVKQTYKGDAFNDYIYSTLSKPHFYINSFFIINDLKALKNKKIFIKL